MDKDTILKFAFMLFQYAIISLVMALFVVIIFEIYIVINKYKQKLK